MSLNAWAPETLKYQLDISESDSTGLALSAPAPRPHGGLQEVELAKLLVERFEATGGRPGLTRVPLFIRDARRDTSATY
jgi:hypothetical protein